MVDRESTRRRFLVAAITYSGMLSSGIGLSVLRTSSAWAKASAPEDEATLGRFARLLYPHNAIGDEVYAQVMGSILATVAENPGLDAALAGAVSTLNSARDANWFDLDEASQIAVMNEVQGESFFAAIQAQVGGAFYSHPTVWQLIKYPGSSKEHGGYVDRGFDDIDWLPEEV